MKELMKKILMWSLAVIAIMSIIVLAGEPDDSVTFSEFIVPKVIALVVFAGCVLFGRHAQRRGWFPEGEKPFNED